MLRLLWYRWRLYRHFRTRIRQIVALIEQLPGQKYTTYLGNHPVKIAIVACELSVYIGERHQYYPPTIIEFSFNQNTSSWPDNHGWQELNQLLEEGLIPRLEAVVAEVLQEKRQQARVNAPWMQTRDLLQELAGRKDLGSEESRLLLRACSPGKEDELLRPITEDEPLYPMIDTLPHKEI